MKKLLYLFLTMIIMAACDFETSNNGKLDGNWQLAQLDTLSTGGSADMRASTFYLSVQHHLLEMKILNDHLKNVFFRFEQTETTLRLYNPVSDNKEISDSVRHKVNLKVIELASAELVLGILFHDPDVNVKSADFQLVENDVLHYVIFFECERRILLMAEGDVFCREKLFRF